MQLLKPVDYKLKVHLIINTSSMLKFQLRKTQEIIGIKLMADASTFSQKKDSRQRAVSWY